MIARALTVAETAGARRAAALAATLATAIETEIPGVTATVIDQGVAIAGRGLRQRMLRDARLRWLGGWVR